MIRTVKNPASVLDDPVVAEVRAIRAQLWKEGGGTVSGYLELVHKLAGNGANGRKPVARKARRRGKKTKRD